MSVRVPSHQQICLNQLQLTCKHICICGAEPAGIYVTHASDLQLQLHQTIKLVCYSCTWPATLHTISIQHKSAVTVSSYKHPCILHLNLAISHGCNNCIRPFVKSFTSAFNQQSCLLNLHLQACMSDTLAPDQHSYLLKQYPTTCAVCCTH